MARKPRSESSGLALPEENPGDAVPSSIPDIDDPNFLASALDGDGRHGPPPSQGDVLSITNPPGQNNPLYLLYEGGRKIEHWGPRGNRTVPEAIAEAEIFSENTSLSHPGSTIRGDHMKRITKQRAHRFLYSMGRPKMSPLEFGSLVGFAALIFGVVFILAIVYAP